MLGTFVGSVVLLVMGTLAVFRIAWQEIAAFTFGADPSPSSAERASSQQENAQRLGTFSPRNVEHIGVQFIQVTDIILLGTVLYIVSLGLYQLFLDPEHKLKVPPWLVVGDLGDLKRDLLSVTVVLLGVTFLGEVVDWNGEGDILRLGAAIALVVAALGVIIWLTPKTHEREDLPG